MSIDLGIQQLDTRVHAARDFGPRRADWIEYLAERESGGFPHPDWLDVLHRALGHTPYYIEARRGDRLVGVLPLALVQSLLFGRFLVSLPYLNAAGIAANDSETAAALAGEAVRLADALDVKYLELRHEQRVAHPALNAELTSKVQMQLKLPGSPAALWDGFKSKLRSQIKKAREFDLQAAWNGPAALPDFYRVFCRNMRDLGTPVYPLRLFQGILETFPGEAEICVIRKGAEPIAAGLLIHRAGVTEVPSASSLREFNRTNANMLLYWHLLERAVQRGQAVFDFGRSSAGSNTYRFKEQWGAQPVPTVWQYYLRRGTVGEMRPDNIKYQALIRVWQKLPVPVTRWLGPPIVRGIP